jgi:hypothetical protein
MSSLNVNTHVHINIKRLGILLAIVLIGWCVRNISGLREPFATAESPHGVGVGESEITGYNDTIDITNKSVEPWEHHQVHALLPMDLPVKYPKAYYYELDNQTFQNALNKSFHLAALSPMSSMATPGQENWQRVTTTDTDILVAYSTAKNYLSQVLVDKAKLFQLPDGSSPNLQIIHDVMVSIYKYKYKTTSTGEGEKYLINMDVILYRESKYQAKSVRCVCIVTRLPNTNTWKVKVVDMHVTGVISEGDFGLFPVVGFDELDDYAAVSPVPPSLPRDIIPDPTPAPTRVVKPNPKPKNKPPPRKPTHPSK